MTYNYKDRKTAFSLGCITLDKRGNIGFLLSLRNSDGSTYTHVESNVEELDNISLPSPFDEEIPSSSIQCAVENLVRKISI